MNHTWNKIELFHEHSVWYGFRNNPSTVKWNFFYIIVSKSILIWSFTFILVAGSFGLVGNFINIVVLCSKEMRNKCFNNLLTVLNITDRSGWIKEIQYRNLDLVSFLFYLSEPNKGRVFVPFCIDPVCSIWIMSGVNNQKKGQV